MGTEPPRSKRGEPVRRSVNVAHLPHRAYPEAAGEAATRFTIGAGVGSKKWTITITQGNAAHILWEQPDTP